jgi:hypothetical protein
MQPPSPEGGQGRWLLVANCILQSHLFPILRSILPTQDFFLQKQPTSNNIQSISFATLNFHEKD